MARNTIELPGGPRKAEDAEVEIWVRWLIDLIGGDQWARRRQAIEEFLASRDGLWPHDLASTSFVPDDVAAWQ